MTDNRGRSHGHEGPGRFLASSLNMVGLMGFEQGGETLGGPETRTAAGWVVTTSFNER